MAHLCLNFARPSNVDLCTFDLKISQHLISMGSCLPTADFLELSILELLAGTDRRTNGRTDRQTRSNVLLCATGHAHCNSYCCRLCTVICDIESPVKFLYFSQYIFFGDSLFRSLPFLVRFLSYEDSCLLCLPCEPLAPTVQTAGGGTRRLLTDDPVSVSSAVRTGD